MPNFTTRQIAAAALPILRQAQREVAEQLEYLAYCQKHDRQVLRCVHGVWFNAEYVTECMDCEDGMFYEDSTPLELRRWALDMGLHNLEVDARKAEVEARRPSWTDSPF